MGLKFCSHVVVNTWTTKTTSWILKPYEVHYPTLADIPDIDFEPEFVKALIEAVLELKPKINIPKSFTMLTLPRYYLIVLTEHEGLIGVVDIIGIRNTFRPTKWGYLTGYWHPQCQLDIASALRDLLSASTVKAQAQA